MKIYKKKDLAFKRGVFVVDATGDVVMPSVEVILQANALETAVQEAKYENSLPKMDVSDTKPFKRKSAFDVEDAFTAETPTFDKAIEETIAIMDEIDDKEAADKMNDMLKRLDKLLDFVENDDVICTEVTVNKFDTPVLGDPLQWTRDDLLTAIVTIHNYETEEPEAEIRRIQGAN